MGPILVVGRPIFPIPQLLHVVGKWQLVQTVPGLQVYLIGPKPGLLYRALIGDAMVEGTVIVRG